MKMFDMNGKQVHPVWDTTMSYACCKLQQIIEGFLNSDQTSVELVPDKDEYSSMTTAASAVRACAKKRSNLLKVSTKQGHLYLTKDW